MSWIDGWWARLRPWLRRRAAEREIEEEFAFHVETEAARRRAAGMADADATRAARVSFGGAAQYREEVRDVWAGRLSGVGSDISRGLRRVVRRPGFALVGILTLGLGIGANTAIYSLVQSVLLRPLPYADPDRLVVLWQRTGDLADDTWVSEREIVGYQSSVDAFAGVAAYTDANVNLDEGEPERVLAALVTGNLFETLGASAIVGRTIGPDDARPGGPPVAVVSHGVWQRQLGGRDDVIGASIRVSGRPATVVGVMPPDFRLPLDYREPRPTEIFLPNPIDTAQELPWGDRSHFVVARLAAGVTVSQAAAAVLAVHRRWTQEVAELADDDLEARVPLPIANLLFRDVGRALALLFVAVGLLLVVACANVAHLLLARGQSRRRELSTAAALGASRGRLALELFAESAVLAVAGAAAGLAVAYVAIDAAVALAPINIIRTAGVELDAGVLAFTALASLVATLVAGLLPAVSLSRTRVAEALGGGRAVGSPVGRGPRRALVVGEMAVSLVLVLVAALVAQSYRELQGVDLGFRTDRVVTFRVDLPTAAYQEPGRANRFFRDAVDRFAAVPGVESAGAVRVLPLSGTIGDWSITIEHKPRVTGENPNGDWQVVTPGYFETLGIPLVRGRAIETRDDETAPLVAVISETMADRYWTGEDAIGKRFHLGTANQPWIEIVGIANTVRHNAVVEEARAEMYVPHAQWTRATGGGSPRYGMTLVARTAGRPDAVMPRLRDEIRALDARLPVSEVRTLEEVAASALAEPRFTALLLSAFALVALALAGIGLYGLIAFVTASRTREIGVRVALGARRSSLCLLLVGDGLALAGTGVVIGLVASIWAARLLSGQLYGISTFDPATFALAACALMLAAAAAAFVPAWRAVRSSPVDALRLE